MSTLNNHHRPITTLHTESMERMARLAIRSLSVAAVAVYLKSSGGSWRRGFASEEFPQRGPGERAFIQTLTGACIEVVDDVSAHPLLSRCAWPERSAELQFWASAPVQASGQAGSAGQLVVAGLSPRGSSSRDRSPSDSSTSEDVDGLRRTLSDLGELVAEQLEARHLHARMAQMDRVITVGTLAAGVAHEINNPLSFVGGNIQFALRLLEEDDLSGSPIMSEVVDALRDALEGSRRVRDVVRDLHRLASGSGNSNEFTIEPVSVNSALSSSINIARNHVEQRARLTTDIDELPSVMGNESKIGQVFLNLLINAAQAIPRGDVAGNQVHVATSFTDDAVVTSISDTGEGIAQEHLDSIFEPFFSTKASEEGTGLGLAISQHIITTLGGDIEVETAPGKGTTFRVMIPRADSLGPE
ncbi:MAG: sensor histidine kinase [Persicimonas sp.]